LAREARQGPLGPVLIVRAAPLMRGGRPGLLAVQRAIAEASPPWRGIELHGTAQTVIVPL